MAEIIDFEKAKAIYSPRVKNTPPSGSQCDCSIFKEIDQNLDEILFLLISTKNKIPEVN